MTMATWTPILLVLGVHQQLVVHSLDHDLLGLVLANVEPQFQLLLSLLALLDQGRIQALQPVAVVSQTRVGQEVCRLGRAEMSTPVNVQFDITYVRVKCSHWNK